MSKVARRLVAMKSEVPLAVLPVGTANNFARSLGFSLSRDELIEQLHAGNMMPLMSDWRGGLGASAISLRAPARDCLRIICKHQKGTAKGEPKSKADAMRRHVNELRRRLQTYRACQWEIEVDGSNLSGRYLLWHAMNIRSVGPVLTLAPEAKTNDGAFDFVGTREEDRALLLDYFDARAAGKRRMFPLPAKRFTKMRLRWKKWPLHFDDELWPAEDEKPPKRSEIELVVKDSVLRSWRIDENGARFCASPGHTAAFVSYGVPRKRVPPAKTRRRRTGPASNR